METYVAPAPLGDDGNDGSAASPVASLGRALTLGRPAIRLAAGQYTGPFTLGGTVDLRGDEGAVLTGGHANRVLTVANGAHVVLDGIEVRATEHAWMAVSVERDADARLVRCTLTGGEGGGGQPTAIQSWGALHVERSRLHGGPGASATAIAAFGRSTIVDNDIDASNIAVNCYGASIERNRIRAGTYGVYIQGDDVTVRDNHITLTPPARNVRAVFVVSGERHVVEDNTIEGGPDPARWASLRPCTWRFDESSDRDYREATITTNGLWFHGEADGPSGGPYTGPTQDLDDLLEHEPVESLPSELLAEIRAYLRAFLATKEHG